MFDLRKTPLHRHHLAAGARMVDFAGWSMPVQYEGLIAEHSSVRQSCGMFDVSHMGEFLVEGPRAADLLQHRFSNDVARLRDGRSQYTLLVNEDGGVVDDAMIYRWSEDRYLVVVNAANRESDWETLCDSESDAALRDITFDCALLAVQGPRTNEMIEDLVDCDLTGIRRAGILATRIAGLDCWLARTGYTGEDGFEIFLEAGDAAEVFEALCDAGVAPVGLGARNTLRLEAGMALHGHELSAEINPYEANLGGVVRLNKGEFTGSQRLAQVKSEGPARRLFGLKMESRHVPRDGYPVDTEHGTGEVSSGTYSPTLECGIAMAFLPADCKIGDAVEVMVRNQSAPARLCELPFYSNVRRWRAKPS
ncbi:MAG: glycine cleavage system aminomethyltransferase GcvT [Chloroflexi bacterium]|nr:glycine cleavage system aminomethyltransferase GcvT [Chloroflexota bacterium]